MSTGEIPQTSFPQPSGEPRAGGRNLRKLGTTLFAVALLAGVGGFGYLVGTRMTASASTSSGAPSGMAGAPGAGASQARAGTSGGQAAAGQGGAASATSSRAATTVQTTTARQGSLSTGRETAGTVVPTQQSDVSAKTSGTVQDILHTAGATVTQGETVVQLVNSDLQKAVQDAQRSLQQARVDLATQTNANTDQRRQLSLQVNAAQDALTAAQQTLTADENLYRIGAVSQTELTTARNAVTTARANLASAQASLDANERARNETLAGLQLSVQTAQADLQQAQQNAADAAVKAPFSGQISEMTVSDGETVASGGKVFTLVSGAPKVTFDVAPSEASSLHVGQVLPFKVGQATYQVKIDQTPPAPVNSVVTVSARLLGTTLPSLGDVGTVVYSAKVASGITLPTSAVQTDGSRSYVFMVQGGKAKAQDVTVLGESGDTTAVSGVSAGAQVITDPAPGLLDGAAVTVNTSASSAAGAS